LEGGEGEGVSLEVYGCNYSEVRLGYGIICNVEREMQESKKLGVN